MKLRAVLLLLLLTSGAYVMVQTMQEFSAKGFHDILPGPVSDVEQLIFTKPTTTSITPPAWKTTDKEQIERLFAFLSEYELKKKEAHDLLHDLDFNQFTISLEDHEKNLITIMAEDSLIVTSTGDQYEVMDGPLDPDWLVRFIVSSQSGE